MDGDALARFRGGDAGMGATLAGVCGFDFGSMMPPRIGSYRWPELEGRGVDGAAFMWDRLGLLWSVGSGLLSARAGCAVTGGGGSLRLVCGWGVGDCCTGGLPCSVCGAGAWWASSDALVLLLRAGAGLASLGSTALRGFLTFLSAESGADGSLGLGFGPGFFLGWPDAVKPRGAGDAVAAGVGVLRLAGPTPTPTAGARALAFGVAAWSGECGGELRLSGEEASPTFMTPHDGIQAGRLSRKERGGRQRCRRRLAKNMQRTGRFQERWRG